MKEQLLARNMPLVVSLLDEGFLTYVDFALAAQLIQHPCDDEEAKIVFLCHLTAATRQGHLCIIANESTVLPPVSEIWFPSQGPLSPETERLLNTMIPVGRNGLPNTLISNLQKGLVDPISVQTPLCAIGERVYLHRMWTYESLFLINLKNFLDLHPQKGVDMDSLRLQLSGMVESKQLLLAQAAAIEGAMSHPLTLISGGPGTGKTYTAGRLIRLCWEQLDSLQQETYTIAIAAPTGKAAANLQKSLSNAAGDIPALQRVQATTLHRLLALRSNQSPLTSTVQLAEDLIIIDESSMIDMRMMAALFGALKPGSRLIMLGDKHQLPAVDAGAPFADLIAMESLQENMSVCHLNICMRAELQVIIDFASAINSGDVAAAEELLDGHSALRRIKMDEGKSTSATLSHLCAEMEPFFDFDANLLSTPHLLMQQSNRFRALSPLKRGLFGTEQINRSLLKQMQKLSERGKPFIAPIIITKNDYRLDIFNGEVGLLVRAHFQHTHKELELTSHDYALIVGKDGEIRSIPALLLPAFEYAYCLSVHKSQGSEFNHVLLLLPEGSEVFGREVLYTAATRARQKLDLWATQSILESTIKRKSYRLSAAEVLL